MTKSLAASMLIATSQAKGVEERPDLVEIGKRIDYADPSITLRIYSHLLRTDGSRPADALNRAVARLGKK